MGDGAMKIQRWLYGAKAPYIGRPVRPNPPDRNPNDSNYQCFSAEARKTSDQFLLFMGNDLPPGFSCLSTSEKMKVISELANDLRAHLGLKPVALDPPDPFKILNQEIIKIKKNNIIISVEKFEKEHHLHPFLASSRLLALVQALAQLKPEEKAGISREKLKEMLSGMGSAAKGILPELTAMLGKRNLIQLSLFINKKYLMGSGPYFFSDPAAILLAEAGRDAIPFLLENFQNRGAMDALDILRSMKREDRAYAEALLVRMLEDPEKRPWAFVGLTHLASPDSTQIVLPVTRLLDNPDPAIRGNAVRTLGGFAEAGVPNIFLALPLLQSMVLNSSEPEETRQAAAAVRKIEEAAL